MSYLDIEAQLNKIENDLHTKMKQENIIDENDKAVNVAEFDRLLKEAIGKCDELLGQQELEKRYDPNSTNIIFSRKESFRTMMMNKAFTVYVKPRIDREQAIIEQSEHKKPNKHIFSYTKRQFF